jgi:hypothetical protein
MRTDAAIMEAKKARLVALGYPWPESLNDKSRVWLDAEIRAMTPKTKPDRPKSPLAHQSKPLA